MPRDRIGRLLSFLIVLFVLVGCGGASYEPATAAAYAPSAPAEASPGADVAAAAPAREESAASGGGFFDFMSSDSAKSASGAIAQAGGAPPAPPPATTPSPSGKPAPAQGGESAGTVAVARAPMLIYTATFTMAVFEVATSVNRVEEVAHELGGYLARRDDRSITIRVPVDRFRDAVRKIEAIGDVLHRNVEVEDVTAEFKDLELQLKNARAIRDRLAELLAKATKVEESLAIERELGRVAGEIERFEGRMKYLRDRAAFSTVTVSFQPRASEQERRGPFQLPVPWLYELGLGRLLNL
jgi:RNAse (barnase) inhibitor barstar